MTIEACSSPSATRSPLATATTATTASTRPHPRPVTRSTTTAMVTLMTTTARLSSTRTASGSRMRMTTALVMPMTTCSRACRWMGTSPMTTTVMTTTPPPSRALKRSGTTASTRLLGGDFDADGDSRDAVASGSDDTDDEDPDCWDSCLVGVARRLQTAARPLRRIILQHQMTGTGSTSMAPSRPSTATSRRAAGRSASRLRTPSRMTAPATTGWMTASISMAHGPKRGPCDPHRSLWRDDLR